ncbi:ABC transporter permease protein [Bacillus sp. TS-2]|nr:ABC transporter permease protein [Bacillus sp. TS-2]
MDKEILKQAIAEMFVSGSKKGRKWFFPKNVSNEYKVFGNMTVKELFKFMVPAVLLCIGIGSIPPYSSVVFWIIKGLFIIIVITIPIFYINYRPVKYRENIKTKDFINEFLGYQNKQKVFFVKPRKVGGINLERKDL